MIETHRLLLGSIGDESHSIGTSLLEIAFKESGFFVKNLGILNVLEDFFENARDFDAILISCMNGHANLYFEDFPYKLKKFTLKNRVPKVWCLGGNLSISESAESTIRKYRRMGFDIVAPKPISYEEILNRLMIYFYKKKIKQKRIDCLASDNTANISDLEGVNDEPLSDKEFISIRKEVLSNWITGKDVWNAEILRNHSYAHKNLHNLIISRQTNGSKPLVQPRTGVAHTCDEIQILKFLRGRGLDVSSVQLDAASRKNMYKKAEEGVLRTDKGKASFLNGYPVPIHGVKGIEEIVAAIDTPFQIRAGSPDHRLVYEIALAGGASSVEGGFLCYLFPYDKSTSPVENLDYWKYVDKLTEWYYKNFNIVVNREYFGPLTCCLIEPVIPICINIIQAILSAKSGVKCISVGLAEQGNRTQDIAAMKVLYKLTRSYLAAHGFPDCSVSTVYHQYMAAFPHDLDKARDLIVNSSISGVLAGAGRMMTKTPVESHHIPTKEDNAQGLSLTHQGIQLAINTSFNQIIVKQEMELLEREVAAVMKAIEALGGSSIARGAIKAFEKGLLDIPFSPSIFNKHRLITARDIDGAIRFVNPERLPFKEDIINFHKEKIHQRMTLERSTRVAEVLENDLTRIWKGDYLKWPLDGHYIY